MKNPNSLSQKETGEIVHAANELAQKAHAQNAMIVFKKDTNRIRFVQVLQHNLNFLNTNKIISTADLALIMQLMPHIELGSNMLVSLKDHNKMLTVTDLLQELGRKSRTTLSRQINELIRRGIVHQIVDADMISQNGVIKEERPLIMNPEIVFAGNKNKINLDLTYLHLQNDQLEENGVLLPYKIWINKERNGGRLYSRSHYMMLRQRDALKKSN